MSEYYGISTPSSDFFMHYGVKGMKWGVRKAIEKGDNKKLDKQYKKALHKIQKLNTKANIKKSKQEYKDRMDGAKALAGTGALLAGTSLGLKAVGDAMNTRAYIIGGPFGFMDTKNGYKVFAPAGAALGLAGAYQAGKGMAAKYRTTESGNKKAKIKAKEFRNQMAEVFKNTKYKELPDSYKMLNTNESNYSQPSNYNKKHK